MSAGWVSVSASVYDANDRELSVSGDVDWLGNVELNADCDDAAEAGVPRDDVCSALQRAAEAAFERQYEDSQCVEEG